MAEDPLVPPAPPEGRTLKAGVPWPALADGTWPVVFRNTVLPILFWAYCACFVGFFHLRLTAVTSHDCYYHARLAQMFPERAFSRKFPWTQASVWRDRFCNKEFLFHVLMMPFAQNEHEPMKGVRWFAVFLDLGVLFTLYLVLRAQRVPAALIFTLLMLCLGGNFVWRFLMIRSHVLSILLALIGVHFLCRRRWLAVALLGFIYAWAYTFPFVLTFVAAPFVIGRWLAGDGFDWRSLLASALGPVVGLAVHPFTPLTFENFAAILENIRISLGLLAPPPFSLGMENYPYDIATALRLGSFLPVAVLVLGAAIWFARARGGAPAPGRVRAAAWWSGITLGSVGLVLLPWGLHEAESSVWCGASVRLLLGNLPALGAMIYHPRFGERSAEALGLVLAVGLGWATWRMRRRLAPETVGVLCATSAWLVPMHYLCRFEEYAVPLLALSFGLVARDALAGVTLWRGWRRSLAAGGLIGGLLVLLLCAHIYYAQSMYGFLSHPEVPRFRGACQWMAEHLEKDEVVVNIWWSDFPELFYDGYRQRYLTGMDLTYSYRDDPEVPVRLERMREWKVPIDPVWLAERFGARYLVIQDHHARSHKELNTPDWRPVYQDPLARIYALTGPQGPQKKG